MKNNSNNNQIILGNSLRYELPIEVRSNLRKHTLLQSLKTDCQMHSDIRFKLEIDIEFKLDIELISSLEILLYNQLDAVIEKIELAH